MRDKFEDINTTYIRKRLEDMGIVNGQLVDEEKLDKSDFMQQVMKDIENVSNGGKQ